MYKLRAIPLVLLSLALAACEGSTGPDTDHVGTYNLTSINGQNLPVTVTVGADQATVSGGTLTLNADTTFTRTTTAQGATAILGPESGTYRRLGNTLILPAGNSGVILADGTVRLHFGANAFLYVR